MLRGRWAFSAVGRRNLGKRERRDTHSRRTLPAFALIHTVPVSGKRYLFFKPSGQCQDYSKNAAFTGRLSHPCCDAKQPYCTRKTDFLIDEGPGSATPLR